MSEPTPIEMAQVKLLRMCYPNMPEDVATQIAEMPKIIDQQKAVIQDLLEAARLGLQIANESLRRSDDPLVIQILEAIQKAQELQPRGE